VLASEINCHVHGSSVCAELNPGIRLIGGLKHDLGGEGSRERNTALVIDCGLISLADLIRLNAGNIPKLSSRKLHKIYCQHRWEVF
jgi:hypothetical protein